MRLYIKERHHIRELMEFEKKCSKKFSGYTRKVHNKWRMRLQTGW
jgi:hypothetical protein